MNDSVPAFVMLRNSSKDPVEILSLIGEAISAWESMELELAKLHSLFVGKPGDFETVAGFSELATISSKRITKLEKAAAQYFVKHPSQIDEGDLLRLIERARLLTDKRHRVAHGVCSWFAPMLKDGSMGPEREYLWTSPLHAMGRFQNDDGRIGFQYGPRDLLGIRNEFHALFKDVRDFTNRLIPPSSPPLPPLQ